MCRRQAVRDRVPGSAAGLTGAAATPKEAGPAAEAEALLAESVLHLANDPAPVIDYAQRLTQPLTQWKDRPDRLRS